ncbi:MAG TPA: hypothetical protein PKH79_14065, partial [Prolixibacteraceae bacterium]|nr:hypothetical protein [Prolixibacteraceae bacterium]
FFRKERILSASPQLFRLIRATSQNHRFNCDLGIKRKRDNHISIVVSIFVARAGLEPATS